MKFTINSKLVGLLLAFLILGVMLGFALDKPKTELKEVVKNEADWKALKTLDDKVFSLAGDGFSACSETLQAAGNFDTAGMKSGTEKMVELTKEVKVKNSERQIILEKLGY